jgi:hypothetical protein
VAYTPGVDQDLIDAIAPSLAAFVGLVGGVLGVASALISWIREKPKVKVRAVWLHCIPGAHEESVSRVTTTDPKAVGTGDGRVQIEVLNTGYVPVYVREVGVSHVSGQKWLPWPRMHLETRERAPFDESDETSDGVKHSLPCRLEPGAPLRIGLSSLDSDGPAMRTAKYVYAITEDDRLFITRSKLLSALAVWLAEEEIRVKRLRELTRPIMLFSQRDPEDR